MLALALALSTLVGDPADPADPAPPPPVAPAAPTAPVVAPPPAVTGDPADAADPADDKPLPNGVDVHVRVKSVNGVLVRADPLKLWPLDDVVVSADETAPGRYAWELLEKPANSAAALAKNNAVDAGFVFSSGDRKVAGLDEAGDYRVRVTVTSPSGAVGAREILLHVAWPSGPPPKRAPPPDARSPDEQRTTVGSDALLGCLGGCALSGTLGALGGAFAGAAGFASCAALSFGPCTTAGSLVGASIGAQRLHGGGVDLPPWALLGVASEVMGLAALGGTLAAQAYVTSTNGGLVVNDALFYVGYIAGGALVVLGGPVTVAASYLTAAPDEASPAAPASR